ncbi:hypothetical protein SAMN02745203_01575 [Porphyromonas crevioricanis]|nr:hypothetical protein SAMN02745203_01575 [Porphyromonas crevioricanis]
MVEVFISILMICQEYRLNRVFGIDFRNIELKLINIILTPHISFNDMGKFFCLNFSVLLYQFVCCSTLREIFCLYTNNLLCFFIYKENINVSKLFGGIERLTWHNFDLCINI